MLDRLLSEHDHIRQTLNLLEMQFLSLCRGKVPDLSIMRSIIVYIQEYPEKAHHPLDDEIFAVLLDRVDDTMSIHALIKEHSELEKISQRLSETLSSFQKGDVSEKELGKQLLKFLIRQRQHLYNEEIEIYPLIEQFVTDEDWVHIRSTVPLVEDPVFGKRTRDEYKLLYNEIESRH